MPCRCSVIAPAARAASRSRTAATSRRCCSLEEREHLGRVGDVGDQVGHRALRLGHRARPAAALPVALGQRRRGSARRPGGRPAKSSSVVHRARRRARRARSSAAGSARSAASTATPTSTRQALVAGLAPAARARSSEGGSAGGSGSATNVPPPRPRVARRWPLCASAVSAWRSVERAIPSRAHSSRSAGSRAPGGSSPSLIAVPSRSTVSSKAVCERTGREDRLPDRTLGSIAPVGLDRSSRRLTAARSRGRAPSR